MKADAGVARAGRDAGDAGEVLAAWALFVLDERPGPGDRDEHHRSAILDLLLESPSEFVVQLAPDGEVQYLSPSLRRALGVFGDGAEGRPLAGVHALVEDDFTARFSQVLGDLLQAPYRTEFEMAMTTAEGERIVQWRFESLLADGGSVGAILGVGHDVTERRRAEEKRARSELRLRTLVEATHQLIWTTGPGGAIDGPLESWSEFTGQTDEEVLGDGWAEAIHPEDRERVLTTWRAAVAAREVYACEYRLRTGDGAYRWIEAHAVPLPGAEEHARYFGVGHDITERKLAEAAAQRRIELESMVAAVSARLAGTNLEDFPLAVDFALGETGRRLGADRVSLYLLAPDGVALESVRVWRRATGAPEDGDAGHSLERLDWLRHHCRSGLPFVVNSVDDLPREAVREREVFAGMDLESALAMPLLQEPTLVGLLSLEMAAGSSAGGAERRWTEDDVSLVRLIADQLASVYVWRADELNLRSIADGFLAFGPDADKNLAQICHTAGMITAADAVLYSRRRGRDLVTEAGWNLPDGLPRSTPAEGRLDAAVMEATGEQVRVERDLQESLYAHTSPIVGAIGARTYAGLPGAGRRPAGRHAQLSVHWRRYPAREPARAAACAGARRRRRRRAAARARRPRARPGAARAGDGAHGGHPVRRRRRP